MKDGWESNDTPSRSRNVFKSCWIKARKNSLIIAFTDSSQEFLDLLAVLFVGFVLGPNDFKRNTLVEKTRKPRKRHLPFPNNGTLLNAQQVLNSSWRYGMDGYFPYKENQWKSQLFHGVAIIKTMSLLLRSKHWPGRVCSNDLLHGTPLLCQLIYLVVMIALQSWT